MKNIVSVLVAAVSISMMQVAFAQMNHGADVGMDHGAMSGDRSLSSVSSEQEASRPSFMDKIYIDGYEVTFHVMKTAGEMQHGGAQNLMIMVQKNKRAQTNLVVNSKIVDPAGREISKPMMLMGQWYMAGYDMNSRGSYQLMILFKDEDGQKHFGGVRYDAK